MIVRHFCITFLIKILSFFAGLVQSVFVTRLLGPEGKGVFSLVQAEVILFSLVLGLTLPRGVNYFSASNKMKPSKLLAMSLLISGLGLLALILMFVLLGELGKVHFLLPENYSADFFVVYFLMSYFFLSIGNVYYSLLSGLSRFYSLSGLELGIAVARVFAFGYVYFYPPSWEIIKFVFVLDLAISCFQNIFYFLITRYKLKVAFDWSLSWGENFRPLLKYVLPLYWTSLITVLYGRIDLWIIERLLGLVPLGIYSLAMGAAQLLGFFPIAINLVLSTYLSKSDDKEKKMIFSTLSRLNVFFLFSGATFLCLLSDSLVPAIYGIQFAEASAPLKILVWGVVFSSIKFLFLLYNQISIKSGHNIVAELIVLFVSLSLNYLLIPSWGILGSSLSMLIANFLGLYFLLKKVRRQGELDVWECFVPKASDVQAVKNILNKFLGRRKPTGSC